MPHYYNYRWKKRMPSMHDDEKQQKWVRLGRCSWGKHCGSVVSKQRPQLHYVLYNTYENQTEAYDWKREVQFFNEFAMDTSYDVYNWDTGQYQF